MSNYNSQLQSNNTDLQTVLQTLQSKAVAAQATPEISVSSNGLITAIAGTKSSTYQLAFQPAKTITPSAASQIAVSGGYYTGGDITVAGDSNLVAGNIKSGVSIFGVSGTLVEGSGEAAEWFENEDAIVSGTINDYTNDRVTSIGSSVFKGHYNLSTINFPKVTTIGSDAFANCKNLTTANFPAVQNIGPSAFYKCSSLTLISFPLATSIGSFAFNLCYNLTTINFPIVISINSAAFEQCSNLTTVSFPAAKKIDKRAFQTCINLTSVSFPSATSISIYAFAYCKSLTTANFPAVQNIGPSAFEWCDNLTALSFPAAISIGSSAFHGCYKLNSLYLTGSSLCQLKNSNAFLSTPIDGYSASAGTYGSIYVPASLLTSYKKATNWAYFNSRFVGI